MSLIFLQDIQIKCYFFHDFITIFEQCCDFNILRSIKRYYNVKVDSQKKDRLR